MGYKKSPPGDKCRPGGLRGGKSGHRVKAPGGMLELFALHHGFNVAFHIANGLDVKVLHQYVEDVGGNKGRQAAPLKKRPLQIPAFAPLPGTGRPFIPPSLLHVFS